MKQFDNLPSGVRSAIALVTVVALAYGVFVVFKKIKDSDLSKQESEKA